MARRRFLVSVLSCFAGLALATSSAFAQGQGNGVVVDADGVLRTRVFPDPTGMLTRQRLAAAQAALAPDMARPSKLRKVSLNRLEAVVAQRLASGQGLTDDMRLPGRLDPHPQRVLLSRHGRHRDRGPAEGFMPNIAGPSGRHPNGPSDSGTARPGRRAAGLSAQWEAIRGVRRLDRSDAGGLGQDAAVPGRHFRAASRRRMISGLRWA